MRFLTIDELQVRRGQDEILRLAGTVAGEPNLAGVAAAIEAAEAEATSYLLGRYGASLPSTPDLTPAVLKDKVAVLAHRHLAGSVQVAPALQAEAEEARAWLGRVSRGVAHLDLGGSPPVDRGPACIHVSQTNGGSSLSFEALEDW